MCLHVHVLEEQSGHGPAALPAVRPRARGPRPSAVAEPPAPGPPAPASGPFGARPAPRSPPRLHTSDAPIAWTTPTRSQAPSQDPSSSPSPRAHNPDSAPWPMCSPRSPSLRPNLHPPHGEPPGGRAAGAGGLQPTLRGRRGAAEAVPAHVAAPGPAPQRLLSLRGELYSVW